nr:immunoglobulin heavy chain junction region [Macaca mulatta]MOV40929.1 immunoglobulin heavy chain junction region [Macaca mulatta]MOV41535.1 immunoglobulin heavy chain junction region [Macaca mulatta]MOV42084.1 immunoglobulin heavy chain junction region [Macaca mulatta]MOV43475.1 immunoglobulin heavy chain junction region [Macaca mulatta]
CAKDWSAAAHDAFDLW